jgi:hypothetical protein
MDLTRRIEYLLDCILHNRGKIAVDMIELRLSELAALTKAASYGCICLPVDGRLQDDEISSAESVAIEVSPFRVDTTRRQNASSFVSTRISRLARFA